MSDVTHILNVLHRTRSPDAVVGWRGGQAVTHADFIAGVRSWHARLHALPGTRFALYFDDSLAFASALFGAWHAAKTVYLSSDTLPATCTALRPLVDGFAGEFPADCMPIKFGDHVNIDDTEEWPPLQTDALGLVVFTSGSTGEPQAIPKKLSQLAAEIATLEHVFGAHAGRADIIATVSHQHIYGLLFKVLWPLATDRAIHARSLIYPEELAQATTAHDCVLISSPAHLKRLPDSVAWTSAAHRIRAVFSSGGPLPLESARATAGLLGHAPIEVYGSSETGGVAWRQRQPGADERWTRLPGVEVRSDNDVLEIRSAHLPDTAWFRTTDRATLSDDGHLTLHGRVDRIVKIEEKRVSLDLLEARLMRSPLVSEARVLLIDGDRQCIASFLVLSGAGQAALNAHGKHALNCRLRDQLADTVERVALPRRWRYLHALPVNAQGKTTRQELLALLEGERQTTRPLHPHMELLEQDAQRALYALVAPHDLPYFEGHFPQTPILPGVVQVEWALQLARSCFALPPEFRGMQALKFQRLIRPDTPFSLELQHDAAKACVAFRYFSLLGPHASGRLMFGEAHV